MAERTRLTTRLKIGARRAGLGWKPKWSRIDLICSQSRWWVDKHGVLRDINKIDADYQAALLHYFRDNARRLHLLWEFTFHGGGYNDDFSFEYEYGHAADRWIEEQPLVRALAAIVEPA